MDRSSFRVWTHTGERSKLKWKLFFYGLVASNDYFYEGADMGILVMRGRLMTDDFKLLPTGIEMDKCNKGFVRG